MNPEQLKALELSISHWDRICHGIEASCAGAGCACCLQYTTWNCVGCPIRDSYLTNCENLGYDKYDDLHDVFQTIPENRESQIACDYWLGIEWAEKILIRLLTILPTNHPWRTQP